MNFEKAKAEQLEVYCFAKSAEAMQNAVMAILVGQGRTVTPFVETVAGYELLCLAATSIISGRSAAMVKAQKATRQ